MCTLVVSATVYTGVQIVSVCTVVVSVIVCTVGAGHVCVHTVRAEVTTQHRVHSAPCRITTQYRVHHAGSLHNTECTMPQVGL